MKNVYIILTSFILILVLCTSVFASDIENVKSGMDGSNIIDNSFDSNTGIGKAINDLIGLLQIAGTGIALITVTVLGAKYMISAPDERANVKNRFLPILIGSIILFSAVNLVALVADIVQDTLH